MKFGIHASLGVGFSPTGNDYIRIAQKAEELGYHSIWFGDHIVVPEKIEAAYPYTPDGSVGFDRRTPWPDPFALLAGIGTATQKILLGTSVVIVPYRNPLHVAKAIATVDLLSNGRCVFGAGIGWMTEEFEALGESYAERASRTREYIQIMKSLWSGEVSNFHGTYFSYPDVYGLPLPVQKPHPPIYFGGESTPALKRIADLGEGWLPGPVEAAVFKQRVEQLKALMADRGRSFSELYIAMTGDPAQLKQQPEKLAELETLGVQEIICFLTAPDTDGSIANMESTAQALIK